MLKTLYSTQPFQSKRGRLFTPFLKSPPSAINVKCPNCIWYKEFNVTNKHIKSFGYCNKHDALAIYAVENKHLCSKNFKSFVKQNNKMEVWYILMKECLIF
jgi:hypothetical protein